MTMAAWWERAHPRRVALVVMAAVLVLFLYTPKREIGDCVRLVAVPLGGHIAANCDSPSLAKSILHLRRYFTDPNPWRTRPAFIVTMAVAGFLLAPVTVPLAALIDKAGDYHLGARKRAQLRAYLTIGLFNVAIVLLTVSIAAWLLGKPASLPLFITGLAAVVASFDINAGWFWVAHTIMANLLVPVGAMAAFIMGVNASFLRPLRLVVLGLVTVCFSLTYGYFLVCPVAFVLGGLYGFLHGRQWQSWPQLVTALGLYSAAVVAPLAAYFGAYALAGLEMTYEGQSFGQFAWVPMALRDGHGMASLASHVGAFARTLANHFGLWGAALIVGLGVLAVRAAMRWGVWGRAGALLREPILVAGVTAIALMLAFNFLQGYYQPRLQVPILLAVILMLVHIAARLHGARAAALVLWGLALVQTVMAVWAPAVSQT